MEGVGTALRFGLEPGVDLSGRLLRALPQLLFEALDAHGEGKRLFALDEKRARLLGGKQRKRPEFQRVLRRQPLFEAVQPLIQPPCEFERAFIVHHVDEVLALVRRQGEEPVGLIGGVDARQQLAQPAGNQQREGGLPNLFDAQIGQYARDEIVEQRVGREDQNVFRPQRVLQRVQQIGDAVQRDCGLARTGHALHHQRDVRGMADNDILLGLYACYDVAQTLAGGCAQHGLEIRVLRDHVGIENADKLAVFYAELALERQLAAHLAVGRDVVHLAHLAGIVEVGDGRAPVDHRRLDAVRPEHRMLSDIIDLFDAAFLGKVDARKIRAQPGGGHVAHGLLGAVEHNLPNPQKIHVVAFKAECVLKVFLCDGQFLGADKLLLCDDFERFVQMRGFLSGGGMINHGLHLRSSCGCENSNNSLYNEK